MTRSHWSPPSVDCAFYSMNLQTFIVLGLIPEEGGGEVLELSVSWLDVH